MARRRLAFVAGAVLWLAASWITSISCFNGFQPSDGGDAGWDAGDAGCSGFGCLDTGASIDPCGDASLAVRARVLLTQACSGGSETGCHVEFGGQTGLEVDRDGAAWGYDLAACQAQPNCTARCPYGCGIINVPANEMPDVMLVVPGDPDHSYLYWKITGDPRRAAGTGIMPLVIGDVMDWDSGSVDCVAHPANDGCRCAVETIGPWIEAGAP